MKQDLLPLLQFFHIITVQKFFNFVRQQIETRPESLASVSSKIWFLLKSAVP